MKTSSEDADERRLQDAFKTSLISDISKIAGTLNLEGYLVTNYIDEKFLIL